MGRGVGEVEGGQGGEAVLRVEAAGVVGNDSVGVGIHVNIQKLRNT